MQSPLFPHIYFAHLSDNSLLPAYIANAVASVSISKNEDFGMVAIESLACGTPVIAVNE